MKQDQIQNRMMGAYTGASSGFGAATLLNLQGMDEYLACILTAKQRCLSPEPDKRDQHTGVKRLLQYQCGDKIKRMRRLMISRTICWQFF